MPAPFPVSKFVDFNTGKVFLPPMQLFDQHKGIWTLDDYIDFFRCHVEVWQLSPAVEMLKQIESHDNPSAWSHSAFGLLYILTPYFEMVGKILNPDGKAWKTSPDDFNRGFCDIYPKLPISQRIPGTTSFHDNAFPLVGQLRERMRNGLFHLGSPKRFFDIHNKDGYAHDFEVQPVGSGPDDPAPLLLHLANPHRMTRTIVQHFGQFVERLRDPANEAMRDKFKEFADDFHDPNN